MPRVVTAGVPMRTPDVTAGLRGSKGTMFLLVVMPARSSASCAFLARDVAIRPARAGTGGCRCRRRRCRSRARATPSRERARVGDDLRAVVLERGCSASRNATALAAITCISGPPCMPGNTAVSIVLGEARVAQDHAAARPAQRLVRRRRDDVRLADRATGGRPPRPAPRCARCRRTARAPTSSAIARNASKSSVRE